MKKLLLLLMALPLFSMGQNATRDIKSFNHIVVHPHINVELKEGSEEKVEITDSNVDDALIHTKVKGKKLHVYLDDAKITLGKLMQKDKKWNRYKNAIVDVVITYTQLEKLTVYGEEELKIQDELEGKSLKLNLHGEIDINMKSIYVDKFKVAMYGDNHLSIDGGKATSQVVKSYGQNKLTAKDLSGGRMKYANFGENKLLIGNLDLLKVTALGDTYISYKGSPQLEEKITIGEMKLVSR